MKKRKAPFDNTDTKKPGILRMPGSKDSED
jgi:hypothetical protein